MPIKRHELRDKFIPEHYEQAAAKDIWSYVHMVSSDGDKRAADNFNRWEKKDKVSGQRASPGAVILPGRSTKNTFDNMYKNINKQPIKAAECSNFAGHAMAVLLKDPEVVKDYNVCYASIDRIHNIAILLPKDAPPLSNDNKIEGKLPHGSLIVDPWAMAMGYDADKSLAVRPKNYAFKQHLQNIEIHYESMQDKTVQTMAPATSAPASPRTPVSVSPAATPPPASTSVSPPPVSPRTPVSLSPLPASPRTPVSVSPKPTTPSTNFTQTREKLHALLNSGNPAPVTPLTRLTSGAQTQSIKNQLESIKASAPDAKPQKPEIAPKPSGLGPR